MTAHGFRIDRRQERLIVSITGAFDAETVFDLRGQLLSQIVGDTAVLVMNLSATEFMDSSGLGFLVSLSRRGQRDSWTLEIEGAHGQVQRFLQRVGWPTTLAS